MMDRNIHYMRSILIFILLFIFINHGYAQSRHASGFIKGTYDKVSEKYEFSDPQIVDITIKKDEKEYFLIYSSKTYRFMTDHIISVTTTVNGERKTSWYATDQNNNFCVLINIITIATGKESLAILYPKGGDMLIYYYDQN